MTVLEVRHRTRYRYRRPVRFGEHLAMVRPRASHDLHLIALRLGTRPVSNVRWVHDVFSNSIARIAFPEPADELVIDVWFQVSTLRHEEPDYPIAESAAEYPFAYDEQDRIDLGATLQPHLPDPDGALGRWVQRFGGPARRRPTLELLREINAAIRDEFAYTVRHEPGTLTPSELLARGTGSCRDFALFMMEAVRRLGLAARFVSGYLYDPALDGAAEGLQGAGATHAWVEIYLPGCGWLEFDPTNALVGSRHLIRVAVARTPEQAVPVSGTYVGAPEDALGLDVGVSVRAVGGAAAA